LRKENWIARSSQAMTPESARRLMPTVKTKSPAAMPGFLFAIAFLLADAFYLRLPAEEPDDAKDREISAIGRLPMRRSPL
jgi:hypothetical protein